jgi:glycosidase
MRSTPSPPRMFLLAHAVCARGGLGAVAMALFSSLATACAPERDCSVLLWWVGEADRVAAVGDWNGWSPDADPFLPYGEQDGRPAWRLQLDLEPGEYAYQIEVDGQLHNDPYQPLLSWDPWTREETSLLRVADCDQPSLELVHAEATADGALTLEASFLRARGGARLDPDSVTARTASGVALGGTAYPASGLIQLEAAGLPRGKHTVTVQAADRDGQRVRLQVPLWVEERPFSWDDAVIYQVITDRFADEHGQLPAHTPDEIGDRMGGNFAGLTAVIESGYFEDLGVNALWISPVYDNPEGRWRGFDEHSYEAYHGYWPISENEIEPAMGSEAELHALLDAAHTRGIRVLLDVVPNHVHQDHPWYQEHAESWFHQHPDCVCGNYDCPWSTDIETCWFTEYLPDLALEDPAVLEAVMDSTVAWAERFDFDGFRVDAVPMMPRAAVRDLIWRTSALEHPGVPFFTLGETYTGDDYGAIRENLGPFGLDGQFEFPILWALRDFVAWEGGDAQQLEDTIAASEAAWEGSGAVMSPFVGNHDMTRFISEAAGANTAQAWDDPPADPDSDEPYRKLVMAQALVLSLPGAPVLYYGDEIGLPGAGDPDCRRPMQFDLDIRQGWTLERVQRLARGRACSEALRRGERLPLLADGPLYAHLRDAGDGLPAITVLNASDSERTVTLAIPQSISLTEVAFRDLVEDEPGWTLSEARQLEIRVPAWSARVLIPDTQNCEGS